jgi:opacity protein-like surface antigen
LKLKLLLITVLALGGMAQAQGFLSNLSVGAGFEGIFPAATFTKSAAESSAGFNGSTQDTTKSVGVVADARYEFGHHSALDFSVTLNRNSEIFELPNAAGLDFVQTNNAEMIATYIVRLPSNEKLKPYVLVGGGLVRFSPNNNFSTGLIPSSETKPAFAYGFGTDLKLSERWALRLQYRGLVRGEPDFKLAGSFGTGLKSNVSEPSMALVFHF